MEKIKKERLAIVSSYNDLCGNASYTKALKDELSRHYDVTVISLNVDLLRKGDSRSARHHIKNIRKELKSFDCVNIQFEAGLFGAQPYIIRKRFFSVAKACKRLMLTMHRYHGKESYPGIIFLGRLFLQGKLRSFLGSIKKAYAQNRYLPLYNDVIRFCKRNNFPILLHTRRDKQLIEVKFNYHNVFDHPLCFYDQDYIATLAKSYTKKEFCESLSLDEKKIYVGIFGFISQYKGHETAIKALEFLPENYELLILGAQHPHTIQIEEPINKYIEDLLKLIAKKHLMHRIKFSRLINDDEFLKAMLGCDFNILPYLEVNQGGSAIAALSLETNSKTLFSQNRAFFELEKYAPSAFKMFTIGNHLELANAIRSYRQSDYSPHLQAYHKKYNINTSAELHKKLLTPV